MNFLYLLIFFTFNTFPIALSLEKHKTEAQIKEDLVIDFVTEMVEDPALLKEKENVEILLELEPSFLNQLVKEELLPEFLPIFAEKSTANLFLEVIQGNPQVFKSSEIQDRFFCMPNEEIVKFVENPKNLKCLEVLGEQNQDHLNRLLKIYKNQINNSANYSGDVKLELELLGSYKLAESSNNQINKSGNWSRFNPWLVIKKTTFNVISKISELLYGPKDVDVETEKYIRDIAKYFNISQDFKIKQIDQKILKDTDVKAFVVLDHLYIDSKAFNYLSDNHKVALVLHELYHIVAKHSYKEHVYLGGNLVVSAIAYSGLFNSLHNLRQSNSLVRSITPTLATYSGTLALKQWLNNRQQNLLHQNEYQADSFAARHLGKEQYVSSLRYLSQNSGDNSSTHPLLENRIRAIESLDIDADIALISQNPEFRVKSENNDIILSPYKIPLQSILRPVGYNPGFLLGNPLVRESAKAAVKFISNSVRMALFSKTAGKAVVLEGSIYFSSYFNKLMGSRSKALDKEKLKSIDSLAKKYYEESNLNLADKQLLLKNFHDCFKGTSIDDILYELSPEEFKAVGLVSNLLIERIEHFDYINPNNGLRALEFSKGIKEYGDILGDRFTSSKQYRDLLQVADRIAQRSMGLNFGDACGLSKKTGISIPELFHDSLNNKSQNLNRELIQTLNKAWDRLEDPSLFKESIKSGLEALKKGNVAKAESILSLIKSKYVDFIRDPSIWESICNVFYKSSKSSSKGSNNFLIGSPNQGPGKDPKDKESFFELLISRADKTARSLKFTNMYRDPNTKLWWSRAIKGHSGPHYKVFKEGARGFEWLYDADLLGEIIKDKHKGPIGLFISYKDVIFK